jgi:AcrR family transcriptional regulator
MTGVVGLRERKKVATREALYRAAMELAIQRGFDGFTIEDIADAVEVSRRTFSNYFSSKEDALLFADQARTRILLDSVRARPAHESAWACLIHAAEDFYEAIDVRDVAWVAQARMIRKHPSLLAQQAAIYAERETEIAHVIASRLPEGSAMAPRLIAAAFLTSLRVATDTWLDRPAGTALMPLVREALAASAERFI